MCQALPSFHPSQCNRLSVTDFLQPISVILGSGWQEPQAMRWIEPEYPDITLAVTPASRLSRSPPRVAAFGKSHQVSPTVSPSESNSSIATVEQRAALNERDQSPPSAYCTPGSSVLEGWVFKKHTHAKVVGSQWARRCAGTPAARTDFLEH